MRQLFDNFFQQKFLCIDIQFSFNSPPVSGQGSWDDYDAAWSCEFKFGSWSFDGFSVDVDFYEGRFTGGVLQGVCIEQSGGGGMLWGVTGRGPGGWGVVNLSYMRVRLLGGGVSQGVLLGKGWGSQSTTEYL